MLWRPMPNHSNIYQARCVYITLFISFGPQDAADTSAALLLTATSFHYPTLVLTRPLPLRHFVVVMLVLALSRTCGRTGSSSRPGFL